MVHTLKQNPSIDTFLELSNRFADESGLLGGYCKEPFLSLKSIGIKSSVALFGHALFTIVKRQDLQKVIRVLTGFNGKLIVSDIDNSGAKLIDKPYGIQ
jgi:pantoate kinase